jgi:hypothetical protein
MRIFSAEEEEDDRTSREQMQRGGGGRPALIQVHVENSGILIDY